MNCTESIYLQIWLLIEILKLNGIQSSCALKQNLFRNRSEMRYSIWYGVHTLLILDSDLVPLRNESCNSWGPRSLLWLQDAEYHSNLGAILHLNGKYAAAASSYRRALQLQPNDDITITNLKRVRALMAQRRT